MKSSDKMKNKFQIFGGLLLILFDVIIIKFKKIKKEDLIFTFQIISILVFSIFSLYLNVMFGTIIFTLLIALLMFTISEPKRNYIIIFIFFAFITMLADGSKYIETHQEKEKIIKVYNNHKDFMRYKCDTINLSNIKKYPEWDKEKNHWYKNVQLYKEISVNTRYPFIGMSDSYFIEEIK